MGRWGEKSSETLKIPIIGITIFIVLVITVAFWAVMFIPRTLLFWAFNEDARLKQAIMRNFGK